MKKKITLTLLGLCCFVLSQAQIFEGKGGLVKLKGVAPDETIVAESKTLRSLINSSNGEFNFRQNLRLFSWGQGEKQKKHAEEQFWECDRFPHATFKGKIIGADLKSTGEKNVKAQGVFTVHGVSKNITVDAQVVVTNGKIAIDCTFPVKLSDYKIQVSQLLNKKIAPVFQVQVKADLTKKAP